MYQERQKLVRIKRKRFRTGARFDSDSCQRFLVPLSFAVRSPSSRAGIEHILIKIRNPCILAGEKGWIATNKLLNISNTPLSPLMLVNTRPQNYSQSLGSSKNCEFALVFGLFGFSLISTGISISSVKVIRGSDSIGRDGAAILRWCRLVQKRLC